MLHSKDMLKKMEELCVLEVLSDALESIQEIDEIAAMELHGAVCSCITLMNNALRKITIIMLKDNCTQELKDKIKNGEV